MRKLLVPLALTLTLVLLSPAHPSTQKTDGAILESDRGSGLYRECKVAIKVGDDLEHSTSDEVDTATKCLRYFQGMTEALSVVEPAGGVCLGPHSTMGTIMHVYVRFMDTHPKYLDENRWDGTFTALQQSYPCKK